MGLAASAEQGRARLASFQSAVAAFFFFFFPSNNVLIKHWFQGKKESAWIAETKWTVEERDLERDVWKNLLSAIFRTSHGGKQERGWRKSCSPKI